MAPNESPSLRRNADGLAPSLWLCASVIIDSSFKTITLVAALTACCQDLCVSGLKEVWKPTTCLSFPPLGPSDGSSYRQLLLVFMCGSFFFFLLLAVPSLVNIQAHRVHRVKSCGALVDSERPEGCFTPCSWLEMRLDLLGIRLLNGISEIQK